MVELSSYTYQQLREWFQSNYPYVALYDSSGSEVTRIDVNNDSRASWSSGPSSNPLAAEIKVDGADSDIPVPVTFNASESFETSSSTSGAGKDPFLDATLHVEADELTLTHEVHLPK